jgi:hypothetical protein
MGRDVIGHAFNGAGLHAAHVEGDRRSCENFTVWIVMVLFPYLNRAEGDGLSIDFWPSPRAGVNVRGLVAGRGSPGLHGAQRRKAGDTPATTKHRQRR